MSKRSYEYCPQTCAPLVSKTVLMSKNSFVFLSVCVKSLSEPKKWVYTHLLIISFEFIHMVFI